MRRLIPGLLLLSGCVSGPGSDARPLVHAKLDEEFTLALGDSIPLDGTAYSVAFHRVIEDSRCPRNTTCVWEGNARVLIELFELPPFATTSRPDPATDITLELNTSPRFPTEKYDTGFIMELRSLEPAPGDDVQPARYKVTLVARRK